MEKGEPTYFDIVSKTAVEGRKQLKVNDLPQDIVPISKEYRVDIEVQSGLAYTKEGQKVAAKELMADMIQLLQSGAIPPQAFKSFVEKWLEAYQFGPVAEFMEAMNEFGEDGSLSNQQIEAMKVAQLQVLKDAGLVGPEAEQNMVDSTKIGVLEALDQPGLIDKMTGPKEQPDKGPSKSISFKDLPDDGKVQLAAQAGIQLSPEAIYVQKAEEAAKVMVKDKGKAGE